MGAVATFLEKTLAGRPIELWGDGSQRRDFVYVGDAVDALVRMGDVDTPRWRILNVGSGKETAIAELCELVFSVSGQRTEVRLLPARRFDVPVNVLDIRRARELLAFDPSTGLEEGIRRTWTWLTNPLGGPSGPAGAPGHGRSS